MSKSYFITGGNGQLGRALAEQYPMATIVDRADFDVTDPASYDSVDWSLYDTFINAAGMTDVDSAETPQGRELAWNVNAIAVGLMAATATRHNLTLIHVSSDYVFDGTKKPHLEDEPFTPLSAYGASKAAGDVAAATAPKHYILRTTWVIGEGKNFASTMLGLAQKGVSPTVVADQVGRLTFTSELARAIDHLLSTGAAFGTYNVTNDGSVSSWADITRKIFELSGHDDLTVTDTSTADYYAGKDGVALRPLESEMSLQKLQASGFTSRDWAVDLQEYIEKETKE